MSLSKNSPLRLFVIIVLLVLLSIVLIFQPLLSITRTQTLVGPEEPSIILVMNNAPLVQIIKAIEKSGKHVDELVWMGGTLLNYAVDDKQMELVVWLLDHGANPDGLEPSLAPLYAAIDYDDVMMVKVLLDAGANADISFGIAMTPREWAEYREKNTEIRELLRNAPVKDKQ